MEYVEMGESDQTRAHRSILQKKHPLLPPAAATTAHAIQTMTTQEAAAPAAGTSASERMMQKADKILESIDSSYIVAVRNHKPRLMPTFRPEEISLGPQLGKGGFGVVNEIAKFSLDADEHHPLDVPVRNSVDEDDNSMGNHDGRVSRVITHPEELSQGTHVHYDIAKARHWMDKRAIRKGIARYALKRLHSDLTDVERARGTVDLAVEAKYLSVVWHPNIIKMRGLFKGSMLDGDFFIILDRLHGTLGNRMKTWGNEQKRHGGFCGFGGNRTILRQMMVDRLTVAYDLAAAFFYLHENRLVYRDIKPENIGFDIRGDVKVFDFGLCKSLSSNLKARGDGYGYRLTGRAGSLPYMAPEVVKMETYDSKCDVFSFSVLLWEILALKESCKDYTPSEFVEKIVVGGERFPIQKSWPPLTRLMLPEAWDPDPRKRPDMKRVAILIRGDLNDMTNDESVRQRTNHMRDRSNHSFHEGLSGGFDEHVIVETEKGGTQQ